MMTILRRCSFLMLGTVLLAGVVGCGGGDEATGPGDENTVLPEESKVGEGLSAPPPIRRPES